MKLPNAHAAIVETGKVADYLLNEAHPDNGGKARFFEAQGYDRQNAEFSSMTFERWRFRQR